MPDAIRSPHGSRARLVPGKGTAGRVVRSVPWRSVGRVLAAVAICESAGVAGVLLTRTGDSPWYRGLRKPAFNPPGWVFGPVWTALYLLMGISLSQLWARRGDPRARPALRAFGLQLLLNAAWTPVFFGLRSVAGGMAVLAGLWVALTVTIVRAWRVRPAAAALLLPYWAWTTFAGVLNASIWFLNRRRA